MENSKFVMVDRVKIDFHKIFKDAAAKGHFTDWARGSDGYKLFVHEQVNFLVGKRRTKPDILVRITACLIGTAYDKYKPQENGDFRELDLAIDLVNGMARTLNGQQITS